MRDARFAGDFGKCEIDGCATCVRRDVRGSIASMWKSSSPLDCSRFLSDNTSCTIFMVQLQLPVEAHLQAGAPQMVWLRLELPTDHSSARLGVTLDLLDKTPTRMPESTSLRFVPAPLVNRDVVIRVSKLSQWVDPSDVVINGSRHLHGVARVDPLA